jgi:hypothetical protein
VIGRLIGSEQLLGGDLLHDHGTPIDPQTRLVVPVVPVSIDFQPYGFFGRIQSIPAGKLTALDVAPLLAESLLRDPRTGAALTDPLVTALVEARRFDNANRLSDMLVKDARLITGAQLDRVREAQKVNSQVEHAHRVKKNLSAIEEKFGLASAGWGSQPPRLRPRGGTLLAEHRRRPTRQGERLTGTPCVLSVQVVFGW